MLTTLQIASEFGSGTVAFEAEESPEIPELATRKPIPYDPLVGLTSKAEDDPRCVAELEYHFPPR